MSDSVQLTVPGRVTADDAAGSVLSLDDSFDLWRIDCAQEVAETLVHAVPALQLHLKSVKLVEQDFSLVTAGFGDGMVQVAEFVFADALPTEQEVLDGIEAFKRNKLDAIILRQFTPEGDVAKYIKLTNVVHVQVTRKLDGAGGKPLYVTHKLGFASVTEHIEQPA